MTSFVFLSALLLGQSCAQVSTEISSQNLSCPLYSSQFFEPNSKNLNITGRAALENLTAIDQNGYVSKPTSDDLSPFANKTRLIRVSAPISTCTSKAEG